MKLLLASELVSRWGACQPTLFASSQACNEPETVIGSVAKNLSDSQQTCTVLSSCGILCTNMLQKDADRYVT